ncbi:MAG: DUF1854 domain-containing protein [Spirochaetaceae bacterium]|nr:DUF1854 domain-containing protein [Spirochaetaceae bacterium]
MSDELSTMNDRAQGANGSGASDASDGYAAEVRMLDPRALRFTATDGGFLALTVTGDTGAEHYPRINAFRTFPLSAADHYLSLRAPDGNEIGMLESLADLRSDQAALLRHELERRYFTPVIERIRSLKEEFGYSYWLVDTDAGQRRFTVQSGKNNVTAVSDTRLLIVDVDGNRFFVDDYRSLDRNVLRTLETLL